MVRWNSTYSLIILMLIFSNSLFAQRHLISEVKINRSSVYVGQPVEVSVAVFTSTWFTKGVDPGNIKVNDAFTVYFRSLSTSKKINGQTYAGVIMYFHVFPYDDEDIEFPSLDINVETPNLGGFEGIKRIVKTNPRTIKVKSVPPGFDKAKWLVTSYMTVKNNWQGDKTNVKVGDVLERKITRNVSGTVSELVPPIIWDTIPNVSLYPTRALVKNNKTKTAISATRSDGVRYLFEKEGEIIIPEKVLTWWNPNQNKMYKRTLKELNITVLPNPDLGMLESVRDSLAVSVASHNEATDEKTALRILGLSAKQLALVFAGVLLLVYLVIKGSKILSRNYKKRREQYRNSELYFFRQFKKALNKKDKDRIVKALYRWIDQMELREPSLQYFSENYGDNELKKDIKLFEYQLNSNKNTVLSLNIKAWSSARRNYLKGRIHAVNSNSDIWINP